MKRTSDDEGQPAETVDKSARSIMNRMNAFKVEWAEDDQKEHVLREFRKQDGSPH